METSIPLIWYLAIAAAFGLLLGYAIGTAIGISTGKAQILKKIRLLVAQRKIDFDVDRLLTGKGAARIKEDFL